MSLSLIIAIGVLGGLGSIARFLLDGAVSIKAGSRFPFGTLAVNASGAFLLGLISALGFSHHLQLALAAGALGGFTTFSTWMFETHHLAGEGLRRFAAFNLAISLALGILLVWAGRSLGGLI